MRARSFAYVPLDADFDVSAVVAFVKSAVEAYLPFLMLSKLRALIGVSEKMSCASLVEPAVASAVFDAVPPAF